MKKTAITTVIIASLLLPVPLLFASEQAQDGTKLAMAERVKNAIEEAKKQTEEIKRGREAFKALQPAKTGGSGLTLTGSIIGIGSERLSVDAKNQITEIYMNSETKINGGNDTPSSLWTKVLNAMKGKKLQATVLYDNSKGYNVASKIDIAGMNSAPSGQNNSAGNTQGSSGGESKKQ